MIYELTFKNIVRFKKSGTVKVKRLNYSCLSKAFKPYFFSQLDFWINADETAGQIYAGWYSWDFTIRKNEYANIAGK